ncbi:glycosyltransferase family 4 protein [Cryobacterium sp. TMT1-3]|uniref:glycosyltransferase family 4 protein n=1 Tax=Cryobacterium sp. TMT1-3 TaxID=1259237 RepID=UPI00141B7867|nr:glycosyltransferase family 4 protein [Cryobacterium sp. TMT1-3]
MPTQKMRSVPAKLSVCFVVTVESTALNFYQGYLSFLEQNGWRVWLIAASAGRLEGFAANENATAVSVQMERDPSPIKDFLSLIRMTRAIYLIRPDVVVTATPKAGLIGGVAAVLCRVPTRVYQLWGLRLETEVGLKRRLLMFTEMITLRSSTQVVANSESLAALVGTLRLAKGLRPLVLGKGSSHGVDIVKFSDQAVFGEVDAATQAFLEKDPSSKTLAFIGRIHDDKGIDTLAVALEICFKFGTKVNVLMIGTKESQRAVDRIDQAARLGPIHWVGEVHDTRPYVNATDILCLPSRREGFPNVVLEAAAMGVPAIVSDATGVVDSVEDGSTGIIFPTDNAVALAQAINVLVKDSALRRDLGLRAQERVRSDFRAESIWALQEKNLREQLGRDIN